jgi:hypothetical protein
LSTLYVWEDPWQGVSEPDIALGCSGAVVGVISPDVLTGLLPHALFAVTLTEPTPVPIVTLTELLVLGAGIDQPSPVTDQV